MAVVEASEQLLELMNQAIAREIQVSIQYMWQHVLWAGAEAFAVKDELKSIAISEMRHAESIAERLFYLGEIPTTKPEPIFIGESLREMLERDAKDEEGAIRPYKQIIALARDEGDETTRRLFEEILSDGEEHHDTFTSLLEEM